MPIKFALRTPHSALRTPHSDTARYPPNKHDLGTAITIQYLNIRNPNQDCEKTGLPLPFHFCSIFTVDRAAHHCCPGRRIRPENLIWRRALCLKLRQAVGVVPIAEITRWESQK